MATTTPTRVKPDAVDVDVDPIATDVDFVTSR